jgi:succinyl-diaminopimelate desuccinylase
MSHIDAVSLTRELIRFDTVNPPGNEQACAEHIAGILAAAGFSITWHDYLPGRPNLVARRGSVSGKPPICLGGHIDTVPFGQAPWRVNPLAGELADGCVWGRGASDMKSGVAAVVAAAVELAHRLDGTPGLTLVFVADEEVGCGGSAALARCAKLLGPAGALIVAEPTSNRPLVGHRGALWLEAETRGKAAHGSMPEQGINAIYKMARAVNVLSTFEFSNQTHPYLGRPTLNVGTIAGGININSVPDRCRAGIDIRSIPGQAHHSLMTQLQQALGEEVLLTRRIDVNGLWTDPQHPWIVSLFDLLTPFLGARPEVATVPYFTDAAMLVPAFGKIPAVVFGPGVPTQAHQTDEYCPVAAIETSTAAFSAIIRHWCGL